MFAVVLASAPGNLTLSTPSPGQAASSTPPSGNSTTFAVPAGLSQFNYRLVPGAGMRATLTRGGQTVIDVIPTNYTFNSTPPTYNFNAYVGTLPEPSTIDRLQPAGLAMLSQGLKVACPTSTLGLNETSAE